MFRSIRKRKNSSDVILVDQTHNPFSFFTMKEKYEEEFLKCVNLIFNIKEEKSEKNLKYKEEFLKYIMSKLCLKCLNLKYKNVIKLD